MVTAYQNWSWSLTLLFIIRIGPSGSSPTIVRSNAAVADPMAELRLSSCSQQLEKLKIETRRHVSALNAISDNSMTAGWRNRKLLSTVQPAESKPKLLPKVPSNLRRAQADSLVRIPQKTEDTAPNSLGKYLSSLDHSGWVSNCLKGGRCSMSDPSAEATDKRSPNEPGTIGNTANFSNSSTKIYYTNSTNRGNLTYSGIGETTQLANETLLFSVFSKKNETVPDPIDRLNVTEPNSVIDLMPPTGEPPVEFGSLTSQPPLEETLIIDVSNHTSESNQPIKDHEFEGLGYPDFKFKNQFNIPVEENTTNSIESGVDSANRLIPRLPQEQSTLPKPVSFSWIPMGESPYDPSGKYSKYQKSSQVNPIEYMPSTNRLVHYNNHFLPVTIQFIPMTYYERQRRGGSPSVDEVLVTSGPTETTFGPNTNVQARILDHPLQPLMHSQDRGAKDKNVHDMESLDSLVANYGNDLYIRGATGKRESEFSFSKKGAVTTTCPEVPSSYASSGKPDSHIFTRVAPGKNTSSSNFFLFVGGNWVADFKDNPRLFYILSQPHQSIKPQPYSEAAVHDVHLPNVPQPTFSENPNCHSSGDLASSPEYNLPLPYSQPSYAVHERDFERSRVPGSVNNARSAYEMKVPSMVAARSGYSWYDYDSMTNDVESRPMDRIFGGGPMAFPNTEELSNIQDGNRKGEFRQRMDDLNYEDSLVNFPPQKYEPQIVGSHDVSASKPEDYLEHDIDTSDMLVLGTQFLTMLPLLPSENFENDTSDPAYGTLVADVSSRSYLGRMSNVQKNPAFTELPNNAYEAQQLANSPRLRLPNQPGLQAPSTYFPQSWPNDFEFVSGQWVKRKLATDVSAQGFIYDQAGRRRIRDVVVARPEINPSNNVQRPIHTFKSECFGRAKRSYYPLNSLRNNILPA